jgi:DNA-directed RNA polymerase specialized sigma24 family protein
MHDLTFEERLVLVRRGIDGRRPAEIAEELGASLRRYRRVLETAGRKFAEGVAQARGDDTLMPPRRDAAATAGST